jgi:predicted ribosome quality control (RQC) complex YloA/Tae2 family protein
MALDGLVVHSLVHELQSCAGGRIGKIHQPTNQDIVMQIRSQNGNHKLLLSANPTYPRVHFTARQFSNPMEAPMFCMLLRKYCEGSVIESIEQVGMERVILMRVRKRDELGDVSVKEIVIEIMGRHSNIILLDPKSGTIHDGIHHVTPAISSYRSVLPGSQYVEPPEQGKLNPLEVDKEAFLAALEEEAGKSEGDVRWDQVIVARFSGVSPLAAREIVYRASVLETSTAGGITERLWNAFDSVMEQIRTHAYEAVIAENTETGKSFFSVIRLTHIQGESQSFRSVSDCLESYYGDKAERDTVKQKTADLHRFLQNEREKNVKKLEKLKETLEEAKDADRLRILGELITASLHTIKKGDKQAEVIDYYDELQRNVTIQLDPLLTPSDNAQRYFKKYTKAKNSMTVVTEQMASSQEEIRYIDILLQQLGSASVVDIEEIREELTEQGYLRSRKRQTKGKKKKKDKPAVTCYQSSEGISMYVGKNNIQNEYLTNRLAQPSDTWLHTKDIPGSHVVIRSSEFGETTLHEAAQLAAYFSQARESSQVPVDYTLVRYVRKPNGAKPGFVIYDRQKTLYVTPEVSALKQLNSSQN